MSPNIYSIPYLPDAASPSLYSLRQQQQAKAVKVASTDLIIKPQDISPELLAAITLEGIGAMELINTARHDLISGNNILYNPIANLSVLNTKYSPLKILSLSDGTPAQFDSYAIALEQYLPELTNISIDANKNVVIEFVNILDGDFVEVEIISQGEVYNDTI